MPYEKGQPSRRAVVELAESQHGRIARWQLLELGVHPQAIQRRIAAWRLRPMLRGVYAVGRRDDTSAGRWMEAVLSYGPDAVLSHESAGVHYGIRKWEPRKIHVSVPNVGHPRSRGQIVVHRRKRLTAADVTVHEGTPITSIVVTLIDLATHVPRSHVEAAINQADSLDLIKAYELPAALDGYARWRGVPILRAILDPLTFVLTDSELERLFLPIARRVGLPKPQTRRYVNSFRVDFYWPDLELVVEVDSLRYHRTPLQQAKDTVRNQKHAATGLTPLRFTHWQVAHDPDYVESILAPVVARLRRSPARTPALPRAS
jgi:very-short-patch-repair endonuclease